MSENEQTDEHVAQYYHFDSWLLWTTVQKRKEEAKRRGEENEYVQYTNESFFFTNESFVSEM